MKPLEYIRKQKQVIIINSIDDNEYKKNEAETIVKKIEHILKLLSECRISRSLTKQVLKENLSANIGIISSPDDLVIAWLLKAMNRDYTYLYAFNSLAMKQNRIAENVVYPIKEPDVDKLMELLENEEQNKISYTKHPTGLDLMRIPGMILEQYDISCEYKYLEVSGFGEIPFPLFALLGIEHLNIDIDTLPLDYYAKGFIEGYNTNLIPFIDTVETRKEVIIKESVIKGGKGFPQYRTGKSIEFEKKPMFERGLFEGKRYKAWEIIFDTPNAFIDWFSPKQNDDIIINNQKPNIEDDIISVNEILKPLSGFWNREKIMTEIDFKILTEHCIAIIKNKGLPEKAKLIPTTNAPTEFIRRTIYSIYKYLGKKNRTDFISLIHLFTQFKNTEQTTTDRKFSNYTGNYENDKEKMITYQ